MSCIKNSLWRLALGSSLGPLLLLIGNQHASLAGIMINQSNQVNWDSVRTSLENHEQNRGNKTMADQGETGGKGGNAAGASKRDAYKPTFDLGIYMGFGGTGTVMMGANNVGQSLLRVGVDMMYSKLYFGADVFGSLGMEVSDFASTVGGAGGQLKLGVSTHNRYATSVYGIGMIQYINFLSHKDQDLLLGFGVGIKQKLTPRMAIFFESNVAFPIQITNNATSGSSHLSTVAVTMFGGIDIYF